MFRETNYHHHKTSWGQVCKIVTKWPQPYPIWGILMFPWKKKDGKSQDLLRLKLFYNVVVIIRIQMTIWQRTGSNPNRTHHVSFFLVTLDCFFLLFLYFVWRPRRSRAYLSWFNFKGGDQQKKVNLLSGGERNRLNLARTLKQVHVFSVMLLRFHNLPLYSRGMCIDCHSKYIKWTPCSYRLIESELIASQSASTVITYLVLQVILVLRYLPCKSGVAVKALYCNTKYT